MNLLMLVYQTRAVPFPTPGTSWVHDILVGGPRTASTTSFSVEEEGRYTTPVYHETETNEAQLPMASIALYVKVGTTRSAVIR